MAGGLSPTLQRCDDRRLRLRQSALHAYLRVVLYCAILPNDAFTPTCDDPSAARESSAGRARELCEAEAPDILLQRRLELAPDLHTTSFHKKPVLIRLTCAGLLCRTEHTV